jgi:transcriptional regulator with XRE-family HTH domain
MAARLQRLREAAGLSQSQLAKQAGVPVGTLQGWEQARRLPRLEAAVRLADALGITLDELVGRESPRRKK